MGPLKLPKSDFYLNPSKNYFAQNNTLGEKSYYWTTKIFEICMQSKEF